MTRRFCGIPTQSLDFPLRHPSQMVIDQRFEARTTRIVLPPTSNMRRSAVLAFKWAFSVPDDVSTREALHHLRSRWFTRGRGHATRGPRND